MSRRRNRKRVVGWASIVGLGIVASLTCAVAGCGKEDETGSGEGCSTDVECKGARVCQAGQCVDPGASGVGGGDDSSTTDGGTLPRVDTNGVVDDPELEAACSDDCKAKLAAGCEKSFGSLDQCVAQCLVVDEQVPYCLEERTKQFACLAAGGYTCINGYPQPKATCITETQVFSLCMQKAPCRGYCARAAGSCAPEGDACISACEQEVASFEDRLCSTYFSQALTCWGRELVCTDGVRQADNCEPALAEVGDCLARRGDACDGFCWLADELGCGSTDCASTCRQSLENARCGSYYERVLDCAFGSHALKMSCVDGVPTTGEDCKSAVQQYTTCMQGP